MPRKSQIHSIEVSESDIEEDYLEVDKSISGQNYVCLSFVSPEKNITNKESYLAYHYIQYRMKYYNDFIKTKFEQLLDLADNNDSISISKISSLRKALNKEFENDICEQSKYISNFDDFKYREEESLNSAFDKEHNFQTSVRGLKVRGVYDTKTEADSRAAMLQRNDQSFDVFVGQVGYWLPWDPCSTKVDNQEYLNKDLNNLVKEYKSNESKKDVFYIEQKQSRSKDALSTAERLRHKLELKKQNEKTAKECLINIPEVSETQESVSLDKLSNPKMSLIDTNVDSMMSEKDPWLQAKEHDTNN